MSNDDRSTRNETCTASDLKASDFFPPGAGWNKAQPQKQPAAQEELDAQDIRADFGRH